MEPITAGRLESHARSVVKGITWRMIGTADTFLWSWLITKKPMAAAAISIAEVFTKVFIYYVHERVWRLIPLDPASRRRSLAKAITWRFFASLDTFILALIFTRKPHYAVSIAGAEAITKIFLYYLHERGWRMIPWGRAPSKRDEPEPPTPVPA